MQNSNKNHFAKMTLLFLVEGLRTSKIPLKRAVEIAEKILAHINLLDTENDFLNLVKELSKDFEQLVVLENKILHDRKIDERKKVEQAVREFAILHLPSNADLAMIVLKEACQGHVTLEVLSVKFPEFKIFLEKYEC